ncbi:hypothetical protein [uncultured Ruegeria sp.]|uniref:hypothetical protein n=1 Tax=uncultured Ruegeria sp. TaxID=259304 RepID=UPI00260DA924|nr:hypothetical protein [uncultured Ruegeria sp.]
MRPTLHLGPGINTASTAHSTIRASGKSREAADQRIAAQAIGGEEPKPTSWIAVSNAVLGAAAPMQVGGILRILRPARNGSSGRQLAARIGGFG